MKVGDRVRNIYTGETGTVLDVWDGKYTADYYEGKQYNPYRIMVRLDNSDPIPSNFMMEHLEEVKDDKTKEVS